eukprot:c12765_g1_i3.p1 GENE.c12765_g1_i3~~c12765_g1_i3.p1  ORF type:complete len:358 (+),score=110.20 c12765_g1_i3:107-1075(+)
MDQWKMLHEAEVMRGARVSSPLASVSDSDMSEAGAASVNAVLLSRDNDRLKEQLQTLEHKYNSVKDLVDNSVHERNQAVSQLEDIQRRFDKKSAVLEEAAKRAQSDAAELRDKYAKLRGETDSLRPKLVILETLQPKVDRLQIQVVEQREQIKELTRVNEELTAKLSSAPNTNNNNTNNTTISNNNATNPTNNTPIKSTSSMLNSGITTPTKAVLMTGQPKHQSPQHTEVSGEDDIFSTDCSWLADAQGLLRKMHQTSDEMKSSAQSVGVLIGAPQNNNSNNSNKIEMLRLVRRKRQQQVMINQLKTKEANLSQTMHQFLLI